MAREGSFFDTNIVLYAFDGDNPVKAKRSKALLHDGGIISAQVLNELANVTLRKWKFTWLEVHDLLDAVRLNFEIVPLTLETHARGLAFAERYQLSIYDSMIAAAAVLAGCTTLYSEDMHDGLVIDGVTIRNPYLIA